MMRTRSNVLMIALLALSLALGILAIPAGAQSSGTQIQGVAVSGSNVPTPYRPVLIGAKTAGGVATTGLIGPGGGLEIEGTTASGGSGTANPFLCAGTDVNGLVRILRVDPVGTVDASPTALILGAKIVTTSTGSDKVHALLEFDETSRALLVGTTGAQDVGVGRPIPTPTIGSAVNTWGTFVCGADASSLAHGIPVCNTSATCATLALIVGGKDGAGNAAIAAIETTTNCAHVTQGINSVLDTISVSGKVTSNGTTLTTIATGASGKCVRVGKLAITNTNTTTLHTVDLVDSNASTVVLLEVIIPANGTFVLDDSGVTKTTGAGNLQFKIDSGGAGTDCIATCLYVLK